ncbi:hypothetical protein Taro_028413 [Colocasia esculenta]|uniref:Uncharacterized protein n=1 Tax=Colocasia esculenta TaxID=4460 RepID=A0A843VL05_COLES|nr:hypothetical protein [Colocasia esculenta]
MTSHRKHSHLRPLQGRGPTSRTTPDLGHRQVGKLHTPVPSRAGTQERDHGTERTPKREPPEAWVCPRPNQRRPRKLGTAGL